MAPVERKVAASAIAAFLATLGSNVITLLIAYRVALSAEQIAAWSALINTLVPAAVYYAGWRAPHTARFDLDIQPDGTRPAAHFQPDQ